MKFVYCSECGTKLPINRRAVQGNIIDIVPQHVCPAEPVPLDLVPVSLPSFEPKRPIGKFESSLDNSRRAFPSGHDSETLRDRRFDV